MTFRDGYFVIEQFDDEQGEPDSLVAIVKLTRHQFEEIFNRQKQIEDRDED